VREISKTAAIQTGEKVVTSGYSDIYPPGLVIGEVIEIESSENDIYQVAVIHPYLDINTVEEVFVLIAD
jgi:rod shape-determining protein MreC